jgi:hypothetical protein
MASETLMTSETAASFESAVWVRVDVEDQTDRKRRRRRQPLIETTDLGLIAHLATALTCDRSDENVNLMMWPTLMITVQEMVPEVMTRIGYLHPGWLRQESWGHDRRLRDPEMLPDLLTKLGWTPP